VQMRLLDASSSRRRCGVKSILFLALAFGSSSFAQVTSIVTVEIQGESKDQTNHFCEDVIKTRIQKELAFKQLEDRIRMKSGICAWHMGDFVHSESQVQLNDLGDKGCRVLTFVTGACHQ